MLVQTATLTACSDCALLIANGDEARDGHADAVAARHPGVWLVIESYEVDEHSVYPCGCCGDRAHGARYPVAAFAQKASVADITVYVETVEVAA